MDTSEQYIKMCEKAEKIQSLRIKQAPWDTWLVGDYYFSNVPLGGCISVHNDASSYGLAKSSIWLPRQDQLQEMVDYPLWDKVMRFKGWFCFRQPKELRQFTSMEQLWLAFVMKEKYNKVWDNDSWIST